VPEDKGLSEILNPLPSTEEYRRDGSERAHDEFKKWGNDASESLVSCPRNTFLCSCGSYRKGIERDQTVPTETSSTFLQDTTIDRA